MPRWLVVLLAVLLAGCRFGTYPDPNDPKEVGPIEVEKLRRDLKSVSDLLNDQQAKGLVTDKEYRDRIKRVAEELLQGSVPKAIAPSEAWEFGELFIAAQRWSDAKSALEMAVKYAREKNDPDRLVNDSLRLARCQAELNDVPGAIATARSVMSVKPTEAAPILPGVLLEIVPAASGKGNDVELAQLLEQAIDCHMRAIVNPKSDAGKAFLFARPFHVRQAWQTVIMLYQRANRPDLSAQASAKGDRMLSSMGSA